MADTVAPGVAAGIRWPRPIAVEQRLRQASGLVMLAFLLTHFAGHALGLMSLRVMNEWQFRLMDYWVLPPGFYVLIAAFVTHLALACMSLYRRRSLAMARWEAVQAGLGFAIPALLAGHVVNTRFAVDLYDVHDSYTYAVAYLYAGWPAALQQMALVGIAWVHGCIGLHFWLRLRDWYRRTSRWWLALAILVPTLALAGFVAARAEAAALAAEYPDWRPKALAQMNLPTADAQARLGRLQRDLLGGLAGLLALTLAARAGRAQMARRRGVVTVRYPGGRSVRAPHGLTVLEVSRQAGIPHAAVCGGRGRCSTCRVRVVAGAERLPEAGAHEAQLLARVKAGPGVRLACQLRPAADLVVVPLLPPSIGARDLAGAYDADRFGREGEVVALFADLRGFTTLAEGRPPFDTVFLLNRFAAEMGSAIEGAGGRVIQFMGDGVFALFGLAVPLDRAARQAVAAAAEMLARMDQVNRDLAASLEAPLRIGIGLHAGPVVIGEMGWGQAQYLTAIGDVINSASRLEALTKDHGCLVVLSAAVADAAGLPRDRLEWRTAEVRGKRLPIDIGLVADAAQLGGGRQRS